MASKKNRKLRIGVLGLTHDHIWDNLPQLAKLKDAELVAAQDLHDPLLERAAKEFGAEPFHSHEELLDRADVDAVFIYGDNATGVEMAEDAAANGTHIMIEKPLASDLEGADCLLAAVRANKVRCMVNWPFSWWPQLQKGLAMAKAGDIGDIWEVKYRAAHEGPREMGCSQYFSDWLYDDELNGGGAFIDYCCYGALLAQYLMGMPTRVSGTAGRFVKDDIMVEDNGVLVMTYPNGLAVSEASWTQVGYFHTYTPVIYGTKGALMIEPRDGGKLWKADAKNPMGKEIKVGKPAPHLRNASANFVHCLKTGEEFYALGNDRLCRDTQEILEAGLISAEAGEEVSLPLSVI